jgi:hypothetical protein
MTLAKHAKLARKNKIKKYIRPEGPEFMPLPA